MQHTHDLINKSNKSSMTMMSFLFFAVTLLGSFGVVKYRGTSVFIWLQLITILVCVLVYKKLWIPYKSIKAIYVCLFFTTVLAQFSSMTQSYKNSAVYIYILLIPSYFCIGYLYHIAKGNLSIFKVIQTALKVMCVVQLIWCVVEIIVYKITGTDLNDFIFVKTLHTTNDASYFKLNQFMPTGFSHHPAVMAPIVVLAFLLFDSPIIKVLVCVVGFCILNSTTVIGVLLCICYELFKFFRGKYRHVRKKTIITILAILIIGIIVFISTKAYESIFATVSNLYSRISVAGYDSSSNVHKRYFTSYPDVLKISSIQQIIFGYGEGCSGYPFGVLFNQYTYLGNWSVESAIMDCLISRGILGFIFTYLFLIRTAVKGFKVNEKYTACMIIWMFQGITYQIQFDWLFFIEMIFYVAISLNYNIFDNREMKVID